MYGFDCDGNRRQHRRFFLTDNLEILFHYESITVFIFIVLYKLNELKIVVKSDIKFMEKSFNDLQIKSISELTVPKQLEGIIQLTSCLANSQLEDSLVFKLINEYSICPDFIKFLLESMSLIFPQRSSSFSNICKMMQEQKMIENFKILEFEKLFPPGSIFHSIALDDLDGLIAEIEKENFDIDTVYSYYQSAFRSIDSDDYTLIDLACKFGSEKCFALLKLKGATISDKTYIYAVEGGNKSILLSLYNDKNFEITDDHLTAALKYYNNDIFDWLLEMKGSIKDINVAEFFSYGNLKGLLFLIENGLNIDNEYIFSKYVYIFDFLFINHIYSSLL